MTLFIFLSISPKSVSPDEAEKRRTNYQAYRSYLNREGPKALGSKEIPKVRTLRGCFKASGLWVHVCIHYVYSSRELIIKNEQGFPGGSVVKNLPAKAGDIGSTPGPGRSHVPWNS